MPEVKVSIGKLMYMNNWAISIGIEGNNFSASFVIELDDNCKNTSPFAGKVLAFREIKDLHQLLESVINEWESNVE